MTRLQANDRARVTLGDPRPYRTAFRSSAFRLPGRWGAYELPTPIQLTYHLSIMAIAGFRGPLSTQRK